jgi:hypothetical protein
MIRFLMLSPFLMGPAGEEENPGAGGGQGEPPPGAKITNAQLGAKVAQLEAADAARTREHSAALQALADADARRGVEHESALARATRASEDLERLALESRRRLESMAQLAEPVRVARGTGRSNTRVQGGLLVDEGSFVDDDDEREVERPSLLVSELEDLASRLNHADALAIVAMVEARVEHKRWADAGVHPATHVIAEREVRCTYDGQVGTNLVVGKAYEIAKFGNVRRGDQSVSEAVVLKERQHVRSPGSADLPAR